MFAEFPAPWSEALANEGKEQLEQLNDQYSDVLNTAGQTALMLAAKHSCETIYSSILPRSIHIADSTGRNALHYAIEGKGTAFLEAFLLKTVLHKDENGMSPIERAIECRNLDALNFFLGHKLLLQENLEAARILAAEVKAEEIVKALNDYVPLDDNNTTGAKQTSSSDCADHANKKAITTEAKQIIAQIRQELTSSPGKADTSMVALLKLVSITPQLGEALVLLYNTRTNKLKEEVRTEKKEAKKLAEDVKSGISSIKILMAEVEKARKEAGDAAISKDMRSEMTDAATQMEEVVEQSSIAVDMADNEVQVSSEKECAGCERLQKEMEKIKANLDRTAKTLQNLMCESDEKVAQLQMTLEERDAIIKSCNHQIAEFEANREKIAPALEASSLTIDRYMTQLLSELQNAKEDLSKNKLNKSALKSTLKTDGSSAGVDEFVSMLGHLKDADNTQVIIEGLFSTLSIALLELLREKHLAKQAISERAHFEGLVIDMQTKLNTQANSQSKVSVKDSDSVLSTQRPPSQKQQPCSGIKELTDDLESLDDAETLGRSLRKSKQDQEKPGQIDPTAPVATYTDSFIKRAIHEASNTSSFTSEQLAKLPQANTSRSIPSASCTSSTSLSSISFLDLAKTRSSSAARSAPGGKRHYLVYKKQDLNAMLIIDQMIKVSKGDTKRPSYLGKNIPFASNDENSASQELSTKDIKDVEEKMQDSDEQPNLFGKRNVKLNLSAAIDAKSSEKPSNSGYRSPRIPDGCSPVKTIVADVSNAWIRNSSPLNKYDSKVMKDKSAIDYYSLVLGKSKSTSSLLAKSLGPDYSV